MGVLSTDMSKAFDSLYPALQINKLKAYGFSNNSLALMRSYFSNKKKWSKDQSRNEKVTGTRPQEAVPSDRSSGLSFGMFSKTIHIFQLMKTGYSCMPTTTNCFKL